MKNYIIPFLFCSLYLNGQSEETNNGFGITIPSGVGIEISGEVEVEFIDVEGKVELNIEMSLSKRLTTEVPLSK